MKETKGQWPSWLPHLFQDNSVNLPDIEDPGRHAGTKAATVAQQRCEKTPSSCLNRGSSEHRHWLRPCAVIVMKKAKNIKPKSASRSTKVRKVSTVFA